MICFFNQLQLQMLQLVNYIVKVKEWKMIMNAYYSEAVMVLSTMQFSSCW